MEGNLQSVVNMMVGLPAAGSQVTATCWSLSATTLRYMYTPRIHHVYTLLYLVQIKDII